MKKWQRFLALMILVIPGAISVYGWKIMRDALFTFFATNTNFPYLLFLWGLFLFLIGIAFVAGFVFYRDKKRRLVQPKFLDDIDE